MGSGASEAAGSSVESSVEVTGASQQEFPRIAVQFEVRQPDGSFLLDMLMIEATAA